MQTLAPFKPHVAINVSNLKQSVDFYRKLFGIEPAKLRAGYAKFDVTNPSLNFTLNESPTREISGLSHMGIQVPSRDDVLTIRERWQNAGLSTRDEMKTECCHALQDKTWVRDPDGNEWEAFVVLQDLSEQAAPERSCCAPACCTDAA